MKILEQLTEKKKRLDAMGPLPSELVKNLEEWFRVELTYNTTPLKETRSRGARPLW